MKSSSPITIKVKCFATNNHLGGYSILNQRISVRCSTFSIPAHLGHFQEEALDGNTTDMQACFCLVCIQVIQVQYA